MKEKNRNPTSKEEGAEFKDKKYKNKINQIDFFTVKIRFYNNVLHLEHLIDAYIKEKLFVTQ